MVGGRGQAVMGDSRHRKVARTTKTLHCDGTSSKRDARPLRVRAVRGSADRARARRCASGGLGPQRRILTQPVLARRARKEFFIVARELVQSTGQAWVLGPQIACRVLPPPYALLVELLLLQLLCLLLLGLPLRLERLKLMMPLQALLLWGKGFKSLLSSNNLLFQSGTSRSALS